MFGPSSRSLPSTPGAFTVSGVPTEVEYVSGLAWGATLTALTVIATVATLLLNAPSKAL